MDILSFILGLQKGKSMGGGSSADVRYVTFIGADGTVLYKKAVAVGDDCVDVVTKGLISTPTKESTAQYDYTYSGWSLISGGAASSSALASVTEDRTVYAAFTANVRYYTITYYDSDGTTVLKTATLAYGSNANYEPKKDGYMLVGWMPELVTVKGNASYTAVWEVDQGWLVKLSAPTYTDYENMKGIEYSPDCTRAFVNAKNRVVMFDTTVEPWVELYSHAYTGSGTSHVPTGLCLSSDGKLLFASHQGKNSATEPGVLMFSVDGDTLTQLNRLSIGSVNAGSEVYSIALSPDETELAVSWWTPQQISFFNVATGENTKTITHSANVYGPVIKYSPCGTKLFAIAAASGRPFCVYDLENNNANVASTYLEDTSIHGKGMAWSPDNKYFAIASATQKVLLFDTSTVPYTSVSIDLSRYSVKYATCVAFSPDGDLLAFGLSEYPYMGVLDMETLTLKDQPRENPPGFSINSIVFNNDTTRLAASHMSTKKPITLYKVRR